VARGAVALASAFRAELQFWLNLVERFFGAITVNAIGGGAYRSVP